MLDYPWDKAFYPGILQGNKTIVPIGLIKGWLV